VSTRQFDFCAYCGHLTEHFDSDGDRACKEGEGCNRRRERVKTVRPYFRWTPEAVALVKERLSKGDTVKRIARALKIPMSKVISKINNTPEIRAVKPKKNKINLNNTPPLKAADGV
jgi:hypothetical protein